MQIMPQINSKVVKIIRALHESYGYLMACIILQMKSFVNMNFNVYFLTRGAKICYLLYAIKQGKVKLCQK